METLETLLDAHATESVYQMELAAQGKQNEKNLRSSYETMQQIATHLFRIIDQYQRLDNQINAAAEAYAKEYEDLLWMCRL